MNDLILLENDIMIETICHLGIWDEQKQFRFCCIVCKVSFVPIRYVSLVMRTRETSLITFYY
jgi:hypothetical protein